MRSCVDLYKELAPGVTLHEAHTPFLAEDHRDSPARGPAGSGPVEECPWCKHTFPPNPYPSINELEKARKAKSKAVGTGTSHSTSATPHGRGAGSTAEGEGRGTQGQIGTSCCKYLDEELERTF